MLLWLTKAPGTDVRIFRPHPAPPPAEFQSPEAALGGAQPRWSVELSAHDTPDTTAAQRQIETICVDSNDDRLRKVPGGRAFRSACRQRHSLTKPLAPPAVGAIFD